MPPVAAVGAFLGANAAAITAGAAVVGAGAAIASSVNAGKATASAQKNAQQAAEQQQNAAIIEQQRQEEVAKEEQKRIEEKFGTLTPEELDREQRQFGLEKERQTELKRRAALSGEELLTEQGGLTKDLIERIRGRQGLSGEELFASEGELNRKIGTEALNDDPLAWLSPELELARMKVNQEANRRGVFGGQPEGGIRFEQLGRANVDLAVKAASERIAQRNALANAYLTLGSSSRSEAGTVAERGLTASERARAELETFLANQQNLAANTRARTTGAAVDASGRAGQAMLTASGRAADSTDRAYATQTDIFGTQAGTAAGEKAAGLSALGKVGGDILLSQIPTRPSTTTTGLTELRGDTYDPIYGLQDLSGSDLANRYSDIRRRS